MVDQREEIASGHIELETDRKEIDVIDMRLIEILRDRRLISAQVQQRRLSHGGPRVAPGREEIVIDRYRRALGPDATPLAHGILRLCRGPAPADAAGQDEPA